MSKLQRITGKTFGATASATGDDSNGPYIGQFGSAKIGSYNGTTDIATIQGLSAWSNGFIDAVTPQNQFPPLPEMTGALKVLSYQENYLLQNGVAEWDENTDYYINQFCRVDNKLYYSLIDNNVGNNPSEDNEHWEEFSPGQRYLIRSYINGSTWYRIYSDGWKEQGGYLATTSTELPWGQPYINADGTLGGNSFAVAASSEDSATRAAWKAFDGDSGSTSSENGWVGGAPPAYIIFYNPTALKVSGLSINQFMGGSGTYPARITAGTIYGSNTNSNYTPLKSFTTSTTRGQTFQVDVNSSEFYNYYKIEITATQPIVSTGSQKAAIREVGITATYFISGASSVVFPISFRDANYSFSLGFENGSGSNVYISSKTATGFSLNNTTEANVCWYACGY